MKENLQDKLVEVLTGIQGAVAKGSDFVLTQLPDVAQQYIAFGRVWALVGLVFCAAVLYVAYRFLHYAITSKKTDGCGDWAGSRIDSMIAGSVSGSIAFIVSCFAVKDALMVWFAPKVWLLIEIANLIHPHK